MSKLYNELAWLYHEMYQEIFDYKSEYERFNGILKEFGCTSILEVGCGSGNLAKFFLEDGYYYKGSDLSEDMLDIARKLNPGIDFIKADMRKLPFDSEFDSVIISGRSFCYMLSNDDVLNCLKSIRTVLKPKGILIFDNFEAKQIMSGYEAEEIKLREKKIGRFKRVDRTSLNMDTGWTWNWEASYYLNEAGEERKLTEDKSVLRAFTRDELQLFLELAGFKVIRSINENVSIFFIAQK